MRAPSGSSGSFGARRGWHDGWRGPLAALGLVLFSGGAGLAMTLVDPLLVIAGLIALGACVAVLRRPYVGLIAYTAIFLLRPAELYPALEPLRLERLVGLFTLLSLVLTQYSGTRRIAFDASRLTRLLVGLVGAALLSMPLAFWRAEATEGVNEFLKILVFYVLIVQLVDSRRRLRTFVIVFFGIIAYQAGVAIYDYLHGSILVAQGIDRAIGRVGGTGANELGSTMAATAPVFLFLGMDRRLGFWRWMYLGLFAVVAYTLVITGSRSAVLGMLAIVGFLSWRSRYRLLALAVAAVALAGTFALLPEQYKGRYETITSGELDASSSLRLVIWKAGLKMVLDRPLTGVGINCYGVANGMKYSPPGRRNWMEAHSLYVQVPAELGLIGAVAFFWFLVESIRTNRRAARAAATRPDWRVEKVLLDALLAGLVAMLVTGIFGHSLLRRTWYVYAALALAIIRIQQAAGMGAEVEAPSRLTPRPR